MRERAVHGNRARRIGATVLVVVAGVAIGACGDSENDSAPSEAASSTGPMQTAEAQKRVDAAKQVPEFKFAGAPFDATKAKGKTIFNVPLASSDPYVAQIDAQMKLVADKIGVDFVNFENKGSTEEHASGIEQAIARNADVIVLQNLGPETLLPQLRKARDAGIEVLVSHWYQNGSTAPAAAQPLVSALVTAPFAEGGRLSMDYAVAKAADELHPLIVTDEEFPISATIVDAMKSELSELCSSCEATVVNVNLADWQTKMSSVVQSALTKDPKINAVLPLYDSMSLGVEAGIRASGKSGNVTITSFNGTPAILKLVQDGDIMIADVGESPDWIGWATMDQALRLAAGIEPIADGNEQTALRVFDDSNVGETGTPPEPGKGYGDAYVQGYEQIWGISGQ